jgi:hypothetical protein
VKVLGAALLGWSAIVVAYVVLNPFGQNELLPCMQLLTRTADCTAGQDAINQAVWSDRTLPSILAITAGYLAIVVVYLARRTGRLRWPGR